MNTQKKETIKNYILDEKLAPEERLERFEVAWDIWDYFDDVLEELALNNFIQPLKKKLEEVLPSSFKVSKFNFGNSYIYKKRKKRWIKAKSIGIYITKSEWQLDSEDRGVVVVAFERFEGRGTKVCLIKNELFSVEVEKELAPKLSAKGLKTTQSWWLGYLPDSDLPETLTAPLFEYYKNILVNPERVVEDCFNSLKRVLDVVQDGEVLELLDEFVEERKRQLSKS
jgi:hypothetical protein